MYTSRVNFIFQVDVEELVRDLIIGRYLKIGSFWKKANIEYQYDGSGRIIKEHRFDETSSAYTDITYQYDSQGRLASSNAISARFYPHCSIERKHSYTYHGNSTVSVKMELFEDDCSPTLEKKRKNP